MNGIEDREVDKESLEVTSGSPVPSQENRQPVDEKTHREICGLLAFMGVEPGTADYRGSYGSLLSLKRRDPATYEKALRLD